MTQISPPPPRRRRAGLGSDRPLPAGYVRAPEEAGAYGADALERRRRASVYRQRRVVPKRRRALRILLFILALFAAGSATFIAVAFAAYNIYRAQLPDASTVGAMEPPLDSYVYDASGKLMAVYHGDTRHDHISLAAMSRWVKLATVDTEDRHFYEEGSWDIPRLASAGIGNLTHSSTAGGSTITEQVAKLSLEGGNLLGPTSPHSLDYKIKEIVLGNEISVAFTKDQILEMYLNRVFYGNGATGIETAAELYFHVDASKLDLAQAAMLAGLPQSPSFYNPVGNETGAKDRQLTVLNAMVSNGDITQTQADNAFAEHLTYYPASTSDPATSATNVNQSFMEYLTGWLRNNFGDAFLDPGGWKIYVTLDPAKQALAQTTVHDQIVANGNQFNMHDASLVSMDPRTGAVVAMVGGYDYGDKYIGQINMALSTVSPGSSIKLFTYTAAIASGKYTMTTPILDAPFVFPVPGNPAGYSPQDYDRKWHGTCQLKQCLGNSFNMPAVKVEYNTGIPYITSLEQAVGVNSINGTCNYNGQTSSNTPGASQWAATLGGLTCGISVLDLADGAATIADLGIHHPATPVSKIVAPSTGQTIYSYDPAKSGVRVVPDNVAYIMNEITSNDANRVTEFGAKGLLTLADRRVSAKTGTGEYFQDNLTVGWTPEFLTAVWVGNPSPYCPGNASTLADGGPCGSLNGVASGITGAAPIWHDFMTAALKGTPADWYTRPPDVISSGGGGDNADFFLPTGQTPAGTGGKCIYWQPEPDPSNPCTYVGTQAPAGTSQPTPQPNPGNGNGNGGGNH